MENGGLMTPAAPLHNECLTAIPFKNVHHPTAPAGRYDHSKDEAASRREIPFRASVRSFRVQNSGLGQSKRPTGEPPTALMRGEMAPDGALRKP
jgi:hypothetical protein